MLEYLFFSRVAVLAEVREKLKFRTYTWSWIYLLKINNNNPLDENFVLIYSKYWIRPKEFKIWWKWAVGKILSFKPGNEVKTVQKNQDFCQVTNMMSIVSFSVKEFGLKRSSPGFSGHLGSWVLGFLIFFMQLLWATQAIDNSSNRSKYGLSLQWLSYTKGSNC